MEFLKDLLNATLLPVGVAIAILLQVLKNLWTNAIKGEIPRYADPVLAVAALAASCFFVWRWHFYLPTDQPPSLLSDVPMQTAILWIGTIFSHFILRQVYGSGRPVGTADELRATIARVDPVVVDKAGVSVTDTKPREFGGAVGLLIALGAGLLLALPANAQPLHSFDRAGVAVTEPDSSLIAFWRLSGYVEAKAATLERADQQQFTAFLPGIGLSYGLTTDMSLVGAIEGDPATQAGWGSAGARLRTYTSQGENPLLMFLGVDVVWPNDKAREILGFQRTRHTELSIRVGSSVARKRDGSTLLAAVASARWSPDERIVIEDLPRRRAPVYTVGIRYQGFGGVPTPTTSDDR